MWLLRKTGVEVGGLVNEIGWLLAKFQKDAGYVVGLSRYYLGLIPTME